MEPGDVTGFVTECVQNLLRAGFDASAFETAKWAGLACLAVIGLAIFAAFFARLARGDSSIEVPITENQFRWLLYIGALLIALPVVAKVTTDQTALEFESTDRAFAQEVCRERADAVAQSAEIGALEAELEVRVASLRGEIAQLRAEVEGTGGDPLLTEGMETQTREAVLGTPVSVFYRSAREGDAQVIAAALRTAGAGVALRNTDLSETAQAGSAIAGDTLILSDIRAGNAPQTVVDILRETGVRITDTVSAQSLRGSPVQVLLY